MSALDASPLPEGFGMRVRGAALSDLPRHPAAADALRDLLARHRVLVLPELRLDADAFIGLAGCLGRLRPSRVRHPSLRPPAADYVFVGARGAASGAPPGPADAALRWHADYSAAATVPALSLMYALRVPEPGSRTGFADMAAVHRALPAALRARIRHLRARHYRHPQGVDVLPDPAAAAVVDRADRQRGTPHPLVMHDARGEPFLFLPAHADSPVDGLSEEAGAELLRQLWSQVERSGRPWDHAQSAGELLIWDNRALLHRRSAWPTDKERRIWFTSVD